MRLRVAAWVLSLLALEPAIARAQPCCTGATTITPARLAPHERALAGLALRFDLKTGAFSSGATYVSGGGESQWGMKQDLIAAVRIISGLQAGATLAFVETWKKAGGESDFGGGLGDLGLSLRYDFLVPGEHEIIPGISLAAGVSIPAGTSVEETTQPLGADATTSGFTQGTLALSISDLLFSRVFVEGLAGFTHWFSRNTEGLEISRGPQLTFSLGATTVVIADLSLGVLGSFDHQGENAVDGVAAAGSSRRSTTLSLLAAFEVGSFRFQASIFDTLPIDGLGKNDPALLGIRFALFGTLL